MASGFVQRWIGKVMAKSLWIGSAGIQLPTLASPSTVSPADLNTLVGVGSAQSLTTASTTTTINGPGGLTSINSSSAITVWTLSAPAAAVEKILDLTVSSAILIKAAAGAAFDQSTNTVIKSTQNSRITLVGISSIAYRIGSVYPGSTLANSILTLTTTT